MEFAPVGPTTSSSRALLLGLVITSHELIETAVMDAANDTAVVTQAMSFGDTSSFMFINHVWDFICYARNQPPDIFRLIKKDDM
jgi:hypothetical protein